MNAPLWQRGLAEALGTAALLCTVIGSGIMAERLSGGNVGVALLANTLATACALVVLIELLGPISGAHFNPLVSLSFTHLNPFLRHFPKGVAAFRTFDALIYIAMQLLGALLGAALANAMFELPLLHASTKVRGGSGQWLGEVLATAALLFVIHRASAKPAALPTSGLVAATIAAGYWVTSSTSFANPVAVFGRMASDTFAGIRPHSALAFVWAQCVGAALGLGLARLLGHPAAAGKG